MTYEKGKNMLCCSLNKHEMLLNIKNYQFCIRLYCILCIWLVKDGVPYFKFEVDEKSELAKSVWPESFQILGTGGIWFF